MIAEKASIRDVDLAGKRVLVRVDYNVPFRSGTNIISDDSRIRASLPTIRHLIELRCRVILCSHLGRPKGGVVEELRMAPVSRRLSELLGVPVTQVLDCIGPEVEEAVKQMPTGGLMMLENLRFYSGEESNDRDFAMVLASLADVYVDDAFAVAHRAHASTEGVTSFVPSVAGFLMARELKVLGRVLDSPQRPFAVVLGGGKVSDKIAVIENLARSTDIVLIGGGMAATFLRANGLEVGESVVEDGRVDFVTRFLEVAHVHGTQICLPDDVVIANSFCEAARCMTVDISDIVPGWHIMDIGPRTISSFRTALSQCRTVIWNGPMGVFEWKPFAGGTVEVANILAALKDATTVVGGGSTAEAVNSLGLSGMMTHVSTGGTASIQFMEGRVLPGVAALMDRTLV